MSCQPSHWTRRNISPDSQHRPVRATVPVSLMRQGSPTKNVNKNENPPIYPTVIDSNDEQLCCQDLFSAVEKPTIFLGPRGEKSKTLNLRTQPQQHCLRRTNSLDAIYLASHCQPEAILLGYCRKFMIDKATQTPGDWNELEWRKAQWKPISTAGEQLEVKYIRQKLQRTNQRVSSGLFCSQRQSPIQADHSVISVSASGVYHQTSPTSLALLHKSAHPPSTHASGPIPIIQPSKPVVTRLQNSVEGLNQEIERLVLKECSELDREGEYTHVLEPTPEGHRAPIAELFHSIQSSPCLTGQESHASSGTASRSHSISPAVPIIPGIPEFSISPHSDESEGVQKLGTSPRINQFFAREPPDGCEKIIIRDEPRRHPHFDFFSSDSDLSKPQVTYVLLPSQSSAFCPLYKDMKTPSSSHYDPYTLVTSTQTNCHE